MTTTFRICLPSLTSGNCDLWSSNLGGTIQSQLREQLCNHSNNLRYRIEISVMEGVKRPAHDIDNYFKPIIDTITKSQLVWHDDEQIDEMTVRRRKDHSRITTEVNIEIHVINQSIVASNAPVPPSAP